MCKLWIFFVFIIIFLEKQYKVPKALSPRCKKAVFLQILNKTNEQQVWVALFSQHGYRVCAISFNNAAKAMKRLHVCYCYSHKLFISHEKEKRKKNFDNFNQWRCWPGLWGFLPLCFLCLCFFSKDMLTYWSVNTFNFLFIYFIAAPDSQRQIKLSLKLLNVVPKKKKKNEMWHNLCDIQPFAADKHKATKGQIRLLTDVRCGCVCFLSLMTY